MSYPSYRSWKIVFGLLFIFLVYFIHQGQFWELAGLYGLICILYAWLGLKSGLDDKIDEKINGWIKLVILFAFPLASDDIYRFYWDGCTILDGFSPFQFKPQDFIQSHPASWQAVYPLLNSPAYYSVYPPVLQFFFGTAAFLSLHSVYFFSILWKGILLLSDWATIRILKKSTFIENRKIVFWYAWNPLVIYEVLANGHPEGLMIYFLVACIYYLKTHKKLQSSLMLGLAAAIKLFPFGLLLFFIKYLGLKSSLRYGLICFGVFGLCLLPIYPYQLNFLDSLHLYFGKFEFNGSLFLLWKALDYRRFGFDNVDHIAPYLSLLFLFWCCFLFIKQKVEDQDSLLNTLFFAWCGYLFLSTTIHPWYVVPVMVLGLMSGQYWILFWTGTVTLSYSWYDLRLSDLVKYLLILLEYSSLIGWWFFSRKINGIISRLHLT